ncbi:MAG: FliA/WhiG family RNA polymerase sigma factor [Planctomycetota bacterium]|nr:FliA/WhiG family RNA polymerase sigma factor [Planctomycetota bacterium]
MRHESFKTWSATIHLSDRQLDSSWKAYRKAGDHEALERLTEHYLPMVKYYCQWFHSRLPREVDIDDVISGGVDGLRRALRAFDPGRGVKFETYCTSCIRGGVLDSLRRGDHMSTLMRRRVSHLNRSREELTAVLCRTPADAELAAHMGLTDSAFVSMVGDVRATHLTRLDRQHPDEQGDIGSCEAETLPDTHCESPVSKLQREALKAVLIRGLSRQERTIMLLYYYEEMTMKEVGAVMGISESRVSQVHDGIVDRLRDAMKGREEEFLPLRHSLPRKAWAAEV